MSTGKLVRVAAPHLSAEADVIEEEEKLLLRVSRIFDMSEDEYEQLKAMHHKDLTASYKVLGVTAKASDRELKRAYSKLVKQYHPDRLAAKDLPPAFEEFAEQLKARDIQLVIVPTPVKPMIPPDKLSGRYDTSGALPQNPSYARFISDIKKGGVLVFDPSTVLRDMRAHGRDCFLPADTHCNPDGMDAVAAALAAFLRKHCEIKAGRDGSYQRAAVPIENIGDIAGMLMLPSGQTLYPPKRYEISQVIS